MRGVAGAFMPGQQADAWGERDLNRLDIAVADVEGVRRAVLEGDDIVAGIIVGEAAEGENTSADVADAVGNLGEQVRATVVFEQEHVD